MKSKTIPGLPQQFFEVPTEFEVVYTSQNGFFDKFPFMSVYTHYKALVTLDVAACSVSQVKTELVIYHEEPIMYAFVIEDSDKYYLVQIGGKQIFKVSKDNIKLSPVKRYRRHFCSLLNNSDAIVETDDKGRIYAMFRRFENGKEILLKKFLFTTTDQRAHRWLEKKKLQ